jgi:hypothetical protein
MTVGTSVNIPADSAAAGIAEVMPRPEEHGKCRDNKERQNSQSHAREHPVGMPVVIHHGYAFLVLILCAQRPRTAQERPERRHHARQRRMLRLIA